MITYPSTEPTAKIQAFPAVAALDGPRLKGLTLADIEKIDAEDLEPEETIAIINTAKAMRAELVDMPGDLSDEDAALLMRWDAVGALHADYLTASIEAMSASRRVS